jgi:predicted nucleic acid-binding protein
LIALDSSVLIDLFQAEDSVAADGVTDALRDALRIGPVVISDIVLAEICTALKNGSEVLRDIEEVGISYMPTEARAALRAGEMQRRYRQRGGPKTRTIPDFLIGAHALLQCQALITRDAGFFRDYFKGLKVIVPKGS